MLLNVFDCSTAFSLFKFVDYWENFDLEFIVAVTYGENRRLKDDYSKYDGSFLCNLLSYDGKR